MQSENKSTARRLTVSIVIIILLALSLCITTLALVYSMVTVEDNLFHTGIVEINLNNGNAVIAEHEFLFEPGMTVNKAFFLENKSTCDVYYKLYFQNVSGGLADILQITIRDGDKVLYQGTPRDLNRDSVAAADDVLKLNEKRILEISFHFPEEAGNEAQNLYLTFDLAADAVQTKNNPQKEFD